MVRSRPACLARTSCALCLLLFALAAGIGSFVHADEPAKPAGRFLFAGDDDWDWASPLGAEEPSKLSRYGKMPWSALDWAEDGFEEVRGVLLGVPPDGKKTMTMDQLSALRGEAAAYRHVEQTPQAVEKLLKEEKPPNVIILMQNTAKSPSLEAKGITDLIRFVKGGGRVVVLDEWKRYHRVLDAFVEESLKLPPGPPIAEPPPPPPLKPTTRPEKPDPPQKDNPGLKKQLEALIPGLGDDQFRAREEASEAILKLGPKVLEFFDGVESDDPEIRARLKELRAELKPKPARNNTANQAERDARRAAKYQQNVALVRSVAEKLRKARIPHEMNDALVDMEKRPLPTLRIEFPVP